MRYGIICAMDEELKDLLENLEDRTDKKVGGTEFYTGKIKGKEVVLVRCGIGKVQSGITTALMIVEFNVDCVINSGSAGGIGNGLHVGDVVLSTGAAYHDADATAFGYKKGQLPGQPQIFEADKKLVSRLEKAAQKTNLNVKTGLIVTGDQFVSSDEAIAQIKAIYPDALCCEMEGAAIAQAAYQLRTPFVVVRAMSDNGNGDAAQSFDEFIIDAGKRSAKMIMALLADEEAFFVERIYADNAGTTPMAAEVIETMTEMMKNVFGNASAVSSFGREARRVLDESRHVIAESINAKSDNEIVFTSGGTESDNTAIMQTAFLRRNEGRHIITTAIEHEAVLKPMAFLESQGYEVTYLSVDENGIIDLNELKDALRDDTILVSVMMGNNEVGSRQPIHEIGEIVSESNAWFHTDCVQAYGILDVDVQKDKIDLLSTSAHKLNGPKFLGFLYEREGLNLKAYLRGGDQELKRRAGTENVPAIAGFAKAVELASADKKELREKFQNLKKKLVEGLEHQEIDFEINGLHDGSELPQIVSLWFKGCQSDALLTNLDLNGIAASAGSACTAGSLEPSHVLTAMYGKDSPKVSESLRFSFGRYNTEEEVEHIIEVLSKTIKRMKKGR